MQLECTGWHARSYRSVHSAHGCCLPHQPKYALPRPRPCTDQLHRSGRQWLSDEHPLVPPSRQQAQRSQPILQTSTAETLPLSGEPTFPYQRFLTLSCRPMLPCLEVSQLHVSYKLYPFNHKCAEKNASSLGRVLLQQCVLLTAKSCSKVVHVLQVVISPRVVSPSLAGTSANSSGPGLWTRLTSSFGYLNDQVMVFPYSGLPGVYAELESLVPDFQIPVEKCKNCQVTIFVRLRRSSATRSIDRQRQGMPLLLSADFYVTRPI